MNRRPPDQRSSFRPDRPARPERPARFDRPQTDRPSGDRGPRPPFGARGPQQGDRPYGDRGPRNDRPYGDRPPGGRGERPARPFDDRGPRNDRPREDRGPRDDRNARGPRNDRDERGARDDRGPREDAVAEQKYVYTDESKHYGEKACLALFHHRAADIVRAYVTEAQLKTFAPLLRWCAEHRKAYHVVRPEELDRLTDSVHHEGVLLLAKNPPKLDDTMLLARAERAKGPSLILWLDGVGNPHNLGALARTAAHFGVPAIVGDQRTLPRSSPSACRIAEGGFEHVQLVPLATPEATLAGLKQRGYTIIATSGASSTNLFTAKLPPRVVLILGNEIDGVSPKLLAAADQVVAIPGTGAVESLNVSVAGALAAAEFWRQNRP